MEINWISIFLAAISTLLVGFVWYHPKVFGNSWMKETGLTKEKLNTGNMTMTFAVSVLYAFFISIILQFLVIHQWGVYSTVGGDTNNESYKLFMTSDNQNAFRTFKHGAFHGFLSGLLLILPTIGVNSLFEKRSFKYVLIAGGYWVVSLMLMGGIISAMR